MKKAGKLGAGPAFTARLEVRCLHCRAATLPLPRTAPACVLETNFHSCPCLTALSWQPAAVQVDYKAPVPAGTDICCCATVEKVEGRKVRLRWSIGWESWWGHDGSLQWAQLVPL